MNLSQTFKRTRRPARRYGHKFKPTTPRQAPRVRSKRKRRYPRPKWAQ